MAETRHRTPRVVVVGAGIGGLVSALLLAQRGVAVQLVEAATAPGGKMRQVLAAGAPVDAGPTVLTMRWIFDRIFEQAGARLEDHLRLTPLSVLARHAWAGEARQHDPDRDRLDLHADRSRSIDAIGRFAGAAEARRFERFCVDAARVYATLEGPYIRSPKPSVAGMIRALGPRGLLELTRLGPLTSLASLLARRFEDPRLRQLFGRYATYCGAAPGLAPATLMLVAHVEMAGVFAPDGGMHAVARALERLAQARGAGFHYGTPVVELLVQQGRAAGVRLADGRRLEADAVVFNGDSDALARGLLGTAAAAAVPPRRDRDRSLSALTVAVRARTRGFELARHNVFFHDPRERPYDAEFEQVFGLRRLPAHGTVYVCAQDRGEPGAPGHDDDAPERLLLLVNAPPDGDRQALGTREIERCETTTQALMARCGLQLQPEPGGWHRTTPSRFNQLFPASGGALYGTATHGWMALFRRPGASTRIPGLLLAGGSVHPGPGVPMAAMSGLVAAEATLASLVSTRPWPLAATSGGTSMRSATTAGTG